MSVLSGGTGIGNPIAGIEMSAYGVMPDSNPKADTTQNTKLMQELIAEGGMLMLTPPGTYYINDTLVIGSNTNLIFGSGVTIKLAPAVNKAMLVTSSLVSQETATVTIAWTAGVRATVTWTAHGLTTDDYVTFQGAAQGEYNNCFRVAEVLTANTFIICLYRKPSATASGTITGYKCAKNFSIEGGTWDYDYTNNPSAAQTYDRHGIVIAFAGNFVVRDIIAKDTYKYGLNTCAVCDYQLYNIKGDEPAEILKTYGPCANGYINGIHGMAWDDCTTIQGKEPPAFIAYMPAFGDVHNIEISNVNVNVRSTGGASGAVVVYASDNEFISGIKYRNVIAECVVGHGFVVRNGTGFTAGVIDSLDVDGITATGKASTNFGIQINCDVRQARFANIHFAPSDETTNQFKTETGFTVSNLLIENCNYVNTAWPTSAGGFLFNIQSACNNFTLRNCNFSLNDTNGRVVNFNTQPVLQALFENINYTDGQYFLQCNSAASGVRNITFLNCRFSSINYGVDVRSLSNITLSGCTFDTLTNGVLRVQTGTGLMCRAYSGGGNLFTSATAIVCVAPATADPIGIDLPVDPAATNINPTAGNIAKRLATGRIMRADGAAWADI